MCDIKLDSDDLKILKVLNIKPSTIDEIFNKTKIKKDLLQTRINILSSKSYPTENPKKLTSLIYKEIIGRKNIEGSDYSILFKPIFSGRFTISDYGRIYYENSVKLKRNKTIKTIINFIGSKFGFTLN